MAKPDVPASIRLYETALGLKDKGRYARAVEKFGDAAAAAALELAMDEDGLVVAFLRAAQAEALMCHSAAPSLTDAESDEARQTVVAVLLPQCVATLTRRKEAGTLLSGSCRAAEAEWKRTASELNHVRDGVPAEFARACARVSSMSLGFDVYMLAASIAFNALTISTMLFSISRELQLLHAAFVASALDLIAKQQELPSVFVDGVKKCSLGSLSERMLVQNAREILFDARTSCFVDGEAFLLMAEAWRRVERSGVVAVRKLMDPPSTSVSVGTCLDAAAAEAAVRGLRTCAMAGCTSKEVHVSQFKRCGACRTVAYCCKEHQVADWPAHKAACKAARKAAEKS